MTEKIRSINISGSSGISVPTLISGPLLSSSSPSSSIISGCGGLQPTSGSGGNIINVLSSNININNTASISNNNDIIHNDIDILGGYNDLNNSGGELNFIMNTSQISTTSNDSIAAIIKPNINLTTHNIVAGSSSCRFPKLEECAHFHYERVQLGPLSVRLADDKSEFLNNTSIASQSISGDVISSSFNNTSYTNTSRLLFIPSTCWFIIKVIPSRSDTFFIRRSYDNLQMLDEMLHRCVYDRKISVLKDLSQLDLKNEDDVEYAVAKYLERFSKIASDSLTCGTILTWFQLDNKGRRLPLADGDTMRSINTPAVGAAYGVRRYVAQACDEISIEVGDMISVIDMPSPAESIWWRGKKSHLQKSHYEVGFFPQSCVATIGDKVPRYFPLPAPLVGQLDSVSPTKPVLRKHGKLIAFFRSFILSRPSRRRLKQSGIYRERVFSCDLSEHLLNSGQEIPMVLKCCAEFIEENGIVDGIYRLSGITSNIQKLRRAFDEERIPDLIHPEIRQDIHAVSSLLKMYFRELPNPLCTYQLYDNFVEAIQMKSDSNERLRLMKETVLKLPPPHYRTLKYLSMHLSKIARHSANTGMTDKNLAIVWAPNLLRSPALESGGVAALRGVGVQAVVTEYLIRNCDLIFDRMDDFNNRYSSNDQKMDSLTDCESLLVEQREHDQSLTLLERPKSLSVGGAKLISLEEAQERHSRLDNFDINNKSMPINAPTNINNVSSYIEVGGGPSSLPDKYHTVLPVPRSWQKRKTHSWKSLFTRNATRNSTSNNDIKTLIVSLPIQQNNDGTIIIDNESTNSESRIKFSDKTTIIGGTGNMRNDVADGICQRRSADDNQHDDKTNKSIDLFDIGKPMDICVRSNSIDSLRTAGHSRSVSHDSYFDLLQSPLRGVATICPSREYSELGINFDREEPEMRIFSESESLVSSPKVIGKENVPPCRRILRARPEEFSSTANSVNPSPKKQPRLNLLSPNGSSVGGGCGVGSETKLPQIWDETLLGTDESSCCKRYKLEDQLSDIQFIDCSTPEHATILNPNSNTVYTSVQIHNPPTTTATTTNNNLLSSNSTNLNNDIDKNNDKQSQIIRENTTFESIFENKDKNLENSHIVTRYSYPIIQLGSKRKDNDAALKERFSYPGSASNGKNVCRMPSLLPPDNKMNISDEEKKIESVEQSRKKTIDPSKAKNRYSYCEPAALLSNKNPTINYIFRSTSADIGKEKNEMEISKLSIATPSSPMQSPRYSLLVGETSSENSSAVNTPIYEMDPIYEIGNRKNSGQNITMEKLNIRNNILDTKDFDYRTLNLEDSCNNSLNNQLDKRDITALKRELSLDLNSGGDICAGNSSKMSVDLTDASLSSNNKHIINIPPSPSNNSNFTDNTSQSITPSEFGYQHLNRQSYAISSENSPNLDSYDNFENTFYNYDNTTTSTKSYSSIIPNTTTTNPLSPTSCKGNSGKASSPIKATISITYNIKSPIKKKNFLDEDEELLCSPTANIPTTPKQIDYDENFIKYNKDYQKPQHQQQTILTKPLLETSFDENMIYEQVKFFRSSVSEVNQMLNNDNNDNLSSPSSSSIQQQQDENNDIDFGKINKKQIVPQLVDRDCVKEVNSNSIIVSSSNDINSKLNQFNINNDDILMSDNIDSLEDDQNLSLYENVEMRKPPTVYENIDINSIKKSKEFQLKCILLENDDNDEDFNDDDDSSKKLEDSLETVDNNDILLKNNDIIEGSPRRSPSNFSVKQLATKFEKSPVEQNQPFDFTSGIRKKLEPVTTNTIIITNSINRESAPCYIRAKNQTNKQQQLNKSGQITRSLDENAFIREFGQKRFEDITKSVQQIEKMDDSSSACIRRKSLQEFTRPKSLNPPKRLPGMPLTVSSGTGDSNTENYRINNEKSKLKLDLEKVEEISSHHLNNKIGENIKITPTTENRICLIQNNVELLRQFSSSDEDRNSLNSSTSSMKVLSGVKLDRERIERIKEERRHQLSEKYRTESFKSKSKTELREFIKDDKFQSSESLRIKSKSRGDIRTMQKEIDNLKSTDIMQFSNRIRRTSDEKNQYNCSTEPVVIPSTIISGGGNVLIDDFQMKSTPTTTTTSASGPTKFDRKSIDFVTRERELADKKTNITRSSISSTREKISPQFSIRDVTAMFESRSQHQ